MTPAALDLFDVLCVGLELSWFEDGEHAGRMGVRLKGDRVVVVGEAALAGLDAAGWVDVQDDADGNPELILPTPKGRYWRERADKAQARRAFRRGVIA